MSDDRGQDGDEARLFRDSVGEVRPVSSDRIAPARTPRRLRPRFREADEAQVLRDLLSDDVDPAELETGEELTFRRPGLRHGLFRKLRRGQLAIGAELDLHGMTVPEARAALLGFIAQCGDRDIRCVRVVHGKGRGSHQRRPVLKHKVDRWLAQIDAVLAYCSARPVDGGTGAVYVLLRRR